MSILLRLLAKIIHILARRISQAVILLLGCFVRLLYWSVCQYGWGRVFGFLCAFTLSALVCFYLLPVGPLGIRFPDPKVILIGLPLLTLSFWCMGKVGLWGSHSVLHMLRVKLQNRQRQRTAETVVPSVPVSPASSGQIWDQAVSWENLMRAWQRVETNGGSAGPDNVTLEAFTMDWENRLRQLRDELVERRYQPQQPRCVDVPKSSGGTRRLAIFNVRDRIAQQSLNQVLVPLWDPRFAQCSYAYRPGRSAHQAIKAVEKSIQNGRHWILDADIESFFDAVSHSQLLRQLDSWLPDDSVRWLISLVMTTAGTNGRGLPQGSPISPVLSNLYLHSFDQALIQRRYAVCRYADDFLVLCPTREQADEALRTSGRLLDALGLSLNDQKTRIVHISQEFTFLGFTFTLEGKHPSQKAVRSISNRLSSVTDETKRQQIKTGWSAYFGEHPPLAERMNAKETESDLPYREVGPDLGREEITEPSSLVNLGGSSESGESDLDWNIYRRLFVGRGDLFARYWQNESGRCGYVPVRNTITEQDMVEHLSERCILGTYLLDQNSCIRSLVFDVDGPTLDEAGRQDAHHLAMLMMAALEEQGISPLLFDSGGKGRHVWLCLSEPVPAKPIRQWAQSFLNRFRPFPQGIMVEVFPKQDFLRGNALGSMIRLPLGRHPKTLRIGTLLDRDGQAVDDPWPVLRTHSPVNLEQHDTPNQIERSSAFDGREIPEPPETISTMIQGCALLRELIEKAAREGDLKHTERLCLLYTLGHCGDAGNAYIHQVMALCSNYDSRVTDRFFQRLEPGHKPIGCFRLREWLKDYMPGVSCQCTGKRKSPLGLLSSTKRQTEKPSPVSPDRDWEMLAEELFDLGGDETED